MGKVSGHSGNGAYSVHYTYDRHGLPATMATTWGSGAGTSTTTTWNFDAASLLLANKVDQAGNAVNYTYNDQDQVATRKWARMTGGSNVTTTYSYDSNTGD